MIQYDLFELYSDSSLMWRGCVEGSQSALAKLGVIGHQTRNECYAMNLRTKEVIGRVNDTQEVLFSILSQGSLTPSTPLLESNRLT